ncbi:MAG: NAD(P)H-dependent oxidoreductase [Gammaproteobacteria bacterium]|nr:NAD(P)H-dependent oxidoreductase [Gammaproteobacteria bacterium]
MRLSNIKVLCLCGSLRRASYNAALIHSLPHLSPDNVELVNFTEMSNLPLFNPDRENEMISSVTNLKEKVAAAHGLIIASPEYAHGISGVLKNALDWLVSTEAFPGMPIALLNTSPRASHAQEALREVLKTMSGIVVEEASISIPLLGSNLDTDGIINHPVISENIHRALITFNKWIVKYSETEGHVN